MAQAIGGGELELESSGLAAEARLLSGYCMDSKHGGSEAGQLRARWRRSWTQGTKGRGVECEVDCWPTPPLFK